MYICVCIYMYINNYVCDSMSFLIAALNMLK